MAVTYRDIGTGGDNTDIDDFLADIPADPAIGDYWVGTCITAMNYSSANEINASNANNAPHVLQVDSSVEFTANAGWPTCASVEGTSARVVAAAVCFYLDTHHWTLTGFLVSSGGSDAAIELGSGDTSNWMIKRFCGYDSAQFAYANGSGGATFADCFTWNCGSTIAAYFVAFAGANPTMRLYNCTHIGGLRGVRNDAAAGRVKCYGVISLNTTTADFAGSFGASSADADYCVSEDTSSDAILNCTNYYKNQTPTSWVQSITASAEDLHYVWSGSAFGDDYSATIGTVDIDGDSGANQGDHVGADYVAAQALTATTISVAFNAPAASVTAPQALTASTASVVFNAPAASISATGPQSVTANTISIVLGAPAASISASRTLAANVQSVTLSGPAASVEASASLDGTAVSVVLQAPAGSVLPGGVTLTASVASVVFTASAGTLTLPINLTATVVSISFSAPAASAVYLVTHYRTVLEVVDGNPLIAVTDRDPLLQVKDGNPLIRVPFRGGT